MKLTYSKDHQVERRIFTNQSSLSIYSIDLSQWVGSTGGSPYLPVDLTLDVEDVEEHLRARQLCSQGERSQVLHVTELQGRTYFVSHIEGVLNKVFQISTNLYFFHVIFLHKVVTMR